MLARFDVHSFLIRREFIFVLTIFHFCFDVLSFFVWRAGWRVLTFAHFLSGAFTICSQFFHDSFPFCS
jgi:hypothetical protein